MEFNERITKLIVSTVLVLLLFGSINLVLTQQSNTIIEKSPLSAGIVDINIIDLGTLPDGISSEACDINNLGEIIGKGDEYACYWSIERKIQGLTDLTEFNADSVTFLEINDLSQCVGWYDPVTLVPEYKYEYRPFFWTPDDGMIDLGILLDGDQGKITGINDLGQVVGWTRAFNGYKHAFLWTSEGGVTDLGTLGGFMSEALDINDLGQIIGSSVTAEGKSHAFLWTPEDEMMIDLGTLGGDQAYPVDINNLGQVVGTSENDVGYSHAFIWTLETGMVDIGTLRVGPIFVNSINDQGYIIGGNSPLEYGVYHAFLWTPENGMTFLAPLGTYASEATDINNLGQIVGYYYLNDNLKGPTHAFLWTPESGFIDLGTLGGESSEAWAINDVGQIVGFRYTEFVFRRAVLWEFQHPTGIMISVIDDLVEEGELTGGQGTALTVKLESAILLIEKGRLIPARNLLQAFINQVNSLIATGALSQEEGEPLINYALELLNMISE